MPIPLIPCCTDEQVQKMIYLGFGTTPIPDRIPLASALIWLRDKKEISVEIHYNNLFPKKRIKRWSVSLVHMTKKRPCPADTLRTGYRNHESAELQGLDDALDELLK